MKQVSPTEILVTINCAYRNLETNMDMTDKQNIVTDSILDDEMEIGVNFMKEEIKEEFIEEESLMSESGRRFSSSNENSTPDVSTEITFPNCIIKQETAEIFAKEEILEITEPFMDENEAAHHSKDENPLKKNYSELLLQNSNQEMVNPLDHQDNWHISLCSSFATRVLHHLI